MNYDQLESKVKELFDNQSLLSDYIDIEHSIDLDQDFDDIYEEIVQCINESNIIYYSSAMTFLTKEDPALKHSLEIAIDLGCSIESLNSELLATLLLQSMMHEELSEIYSELEELIEEYQQEAEEEEELF